MVGSLGAGVGLWESAKVRFTHTGKVQVMTGTHSHGQGHETTFAQVVAEKLGVPYEDIDVIHGDTDKTPVGMGTYGSRSLAVGGEAMVNACNKIVDKGKKIAAHLMEAAEADIEFKDGQFTVAGTDKSVGIGQVAFTAYVPHNYPQGVEPGLEESAFFDPPNFTYPAGTYVCELEVDPATGVVEILKFVAVDDFGNVVNPMIVEGQVHGGLAQGIGQALLESAVYDEGGQLLTGSYMDYTMPRADDVPSFEVVTSAGTACTANSLGVKGCGEAGAIGSPPAVINAITNAIGVRVEMPATPEKVWRAIQGTKLAASGRIEQGRNRSCTSSTIIGRPASRTPRPCSPRNEDAKLLAGGQTYLPTLKQRLAQPTDVIDLGGIAELKGIKEEAGGLTIGAMTRHADVAQLGRGQAGDPVRWRRWPS